MAKFNEGDVLMAVGMLWRERSSPIELRVLTPKGTCSGYFDDPVKLVEAARYWNVRGNIYVTLNEVHPDCAARRLNKVEWTKSGDTTKDAEIIRRTNVYIDLDPVRISGIASTDEEHDAAKAVALEVQRFLSEHGLPEAVLISSGNGYGLFLAIDLPAADGQLVKRFLAALASKFDTDKVKVDKSVFNTSRIARLPGTMNCKGENLPHRPHRLAAIVSAPEILVAATEKQLQAIIDVIEGKPAQTTNQQTKVAHSFDVAKWLTERSVSFQIVEKNDGTQFKLDHCPFKKEDHPAGGCAIFQRNDGTISASCFHSKCKWGWKELRTKLDPSFDVRAEQQVVSGTESIKDPHRLARLILDDYSHADHATILRYQRSFYVWRDGIWKELDQIEIRAIITKRIKEEFDRYAAVMALSGAQCQTPQVTTKLVADVLNALSSLIRVELTDSSCWLDGIGWPSNEILVCKSEIIHLPSYLNGGAVYAISHTPRLFVQNKLEFDFEPNAAAPTRWLQLLDEIWPDDPDSQKLLQEYFGYCLTPDASLQKFLALIGASRGGKGTITNVLSTLIGKPNCCSIRLAKLASRFGLENAVDKSLILVPDAIMPRPERAAEVVELLKAMTGGDAIDVDRKGKPIITAKLPGKVVVTSNNMIGLPDESAALYKRMLVLRFTNSFYGREDIKLEEKLRSELPGVLLWAINGYNRLSKAGRFTVAKSGEKLKQRLAFAGSPVASFVTERCVIDAGQSIEHDETYTGYRAFCEEFVLDVCEQSEFGKKLVEAVPSVDPDYRPKPKSPGGRRPRYYKGIGWNTAATQDSVAPVMSNAQSVVTVASPDDLLTPPARATAGTDFVLAV